MEAVIRLARSWPTGYRVTAFGFQQRRSNRHDQRNVSHQSSGKLVECGTFYFNSAITCSQLITFSTRSSGT